MLFVDASGEFIKVTKNNRLTEQNISRIVDAVTNRSEVKHFSHLAKYEDVVAEKYKVPLLLLL